MCRFHLASPGVRSTLAVAFLLAIGGCAATTDNSLTSRMGDDVRRLTMQCYWQREGERLVVGGMPVYLACREWAQSLVRVKVPRAVALTD